MKFTKLTSPTAADNSRPAAQSAERQSLAEEIECRDDAARELASLDETLSTYWQKTAAARGAIEAAEKAAAAAKDERARYALAQALGQAAGPTPISAADAQAAIEAAQDELASLTQTRASLEALQREKASTLRFRQDAVRAKASAVVRASPAVASLLAEYGEARQAFGELRSAAVWLADLRLLPEGTAFTRNELNSPAAADRWRAALADLERDASAPLPT